MYRTLQTTLLSLLLLANSAALALDSSNEVALATTPLPPLPIWTNLLVITANEALAELPIAWSDRGTPLRLTAARRLPAICANGAALSSGRLRHVATTPLRPRS